jgi:ubiquinone biosynthesis protein
MTGPTPHGDLRHGTFSDTPPWEVDPDAMTWRRGLDRTRAAVRAQVPALVKPKKIPPIGRMAVTVYHLGPGLAAWAGARKWRRRGGAAAPESGPGSLADLSRRLRKGAERLGPAYIKLGQIISAGEGVFPEPLVNEFKLCRDQVAPEPIDDVRRVVEEELGRDIADAFLVFDNQPIAAASIAQVHAATLRTGEPVVVKVQRPTVARRVRSDLEVMAWLAPRLVGRIPVAALANPPALVELFADTITEELDFRLEAENMLDVAKSLAELGQRAYVVPRPHPSLVTRRVLIMERLSGLAFDDVEGMRLAGVDTASLVRAGMIGFLEGATLHGIFHGDLHGGNLLVLPQPAGSPEGARVALLDFGITGRLDEVRRRAFLRLLVGATINDVAGQLRALRDLGALPADTDIQAVIDDLNLEGPPVDPTKMTPDELVGEIQRTVKALLGYGARMPKELMLFVKNLVFLDGAIASLAPDLDLFAEIAHVGQHFATAHGARIAGDVGFDPRAMAIDLSGVKASFGVDLDTEGLTYRELQERRQIIRERLAKREAGAQRRQARRSRRTRP